MKLIIAGGRRYQLTEQDYQHLDTLNNITEVVSGACTGADCGGELWAKSRGIPVKKFLAAWTELGPAAGPIRNREMAQYADAVVLFPGNKGTRSMYSEAKRYRLLIYDWTGKDRQEETSQ